MRTQPSFRDTVNIPLGGYVVLRFRALNPGWWWVMFEHQALLSRNICCRFAHCHLLLHHMGGTAFAFRVGEHSEVPAPPANYPHSCGVYEQPDDEDEEEPIDWSAGMKVSSNEGFVLFLPTVLSLLVTHLLALF